MSATREPDSLQELIDRIADAADSSGRVSLGEALDAIGRRSFGPLLLLAGLAILAPLVGDIPGVPTLIALLVFLSAVQLLAGRRHLWLPQFLLRRAVASDKLCKALGWLRPPARFADRLTRSRLGFLAEGPAITVIAVMCVLIALAVPAMELVPFSANGAGAALTAFGLSLIARDGLLALIAFLVTGVTAGFVLYALL